LILIKSRREQTPWRQLPDYQARQVAGQCLWWFSGKVVLGIHAKAILSCSRLASGDNGDRMEPPMRISRRCGALMLILLVPAAALACLWDSETLKQERSRFPSTLELITGKFLRHSPAFYEWRIKDRLEKLKTDPKNVGLYDDIAVAYEKLGQHDKAIETILAKEEIQPGLYETYSNLGTFYILAGGFLFPSAKGYQPPAGRQPATPSSLPNGWVRNSSAASRRHPPSPACRG
jgi:hypothetical protein